MTVGVDAAEAFVADMGVDGGGIQPGVAQEFLDDTQVRTVIEQVGSAGMPQEVRAAMEGEADLIEVIPDQMAEVAGTEGIAISSEKEGTAGVLRGEKLAPDGGEVALQPVAGHFTDWNHAGLLSLSLRHQQGTAIRSEVVESQGCQLRAADAGGVEEFQNGPVPDADEVRGVRGFDETHHRGLIQHDREVPSGRSPPAALFEGIGGNGPAFTEKGEEAPNAADRSVDGAAGQGCAPAGDPVVEILQPSLDKTGGDPGRIGDALFLTPADEFPAVAPLAHHGHGDSAAFLQVQPPFFQPMLQKGGRHRRFGRFQPALVLPPLLHPQRTLGPGGTRFHSKGLDCISVRFIRSGTS